jgi:glucose dehydrogenase
MQQTIASIFRNVVLIALWVVGPISVCAAWTVLGYLRDDDPNNWPMYNRSFDGSRYSPLKEITKDNVKNLRVAWIHQPGVILQGLPETPLVADGVVYSISAQDRVFALGATTGDELWLPHLPSGVLI